MRKRRFPNVVQGDTHKLADFQIHDLGFSAEASRSQLTRKPKEKRRTSSSSFEFTVWGFWGEAQQHYHGRSKADESSNKYIFSAQI